MKGYLCAIVAVLCAIISCAGAAARVEAAERETSEAALPADEGEMLLDYYVGTTPAREAVGMAAFNAIAALLRSYAMDEEESAPPTLAQRLCRAFEYEEDEVSAIVQFRMIDGELFVEQAGLAYWAAAISPDDPGALSLASAPEVRLAATARRWSGFSMAGDFWDDGVPAEIAVASDDMLTLRFGDDEPITARPCASDTEIHDPARYAEQLHGHLGQGGDIAGMWGSVDGTVSASFGDDGRATVIMRRAGEPPIVMFCIYGQIDPSKIELIAERLGWGGQPFEISGELLPDGSLSLQDGIVLLKR